LCFPVKLEVNKVGTAINKSKQKAVMPLHNGCIPFLQKYAWQRSWGAGELGSGGEFRDKLSSLLFKFAHLGCSPT
jgi:hypothetical protein